MHNLICPRDDLGPPHSASAGPVGRAGSSVADSAWRPSRRRPPRAGLAHHGGDRTDAPRLLAGPCTNLGDLRPYLEPGTTHAVVVAGADDNTHEISLSEASGGDEDALATPTGWTILRVSPPPPQFWG